MAKSDTISASGVRRAAAVPVTLAALFIGVGLTGAAFAAGGGSDASGPVKSCPRGEIYDGTKGKCVKQSSDAVTDDTRYAYGGWLAQTGRYGEAIDVLSLAENKDDPRILNYLGYAHRNLGRFEVGLGYYRQALAVDPNYVKAREYMGEAFVVLGKIDEAREQLSEIATRCGETCEEYRLLAEAIDDYDRARSNRS